MMSCRNPEPALLFRHFARFKKLLQCFRVVLKKMGEVGKDLDRVRTQMMFDAFDVLLLRPRVEPEEREKTGKGFMAFLDAASHSLSLFRQDQPAIFFVIEVTEFAEFLHHAGDRRLFDMQRRRDVHDPRVTLFLDQLMNALQIVFVALAGGWWRGHVAPN